MKFIRKIFYKRHVAKQLERQAWQHEIMAGYNHSNSLELEELYKKEQEKLEDYKSRAAELEGEHKREFRMARQELEQKILTQQKVVEGLDKQITKIRNECQNLRSQAAEVKYRRQYIKHNF